MGVRPRYAGGQATPGPVRCGESSGRLRGLVLALALTSSVAWAQAPRNATLRDFHHTSWTQKDGAPAGVRVMAQTRDGWLWLGTASGLYRFDGVHFERHDLLPAGSIASRSVGVLRAMCNGDLWVGNSFGGASVLDARGEVRHFSPGGLPEGKPVESFDEDGEGRPWAITPQGVHVFEQGVWSSVDARWGCPRTKGPTASWT
ncbi:ligand-binding sensor domain-containing protein [Myxococcus fulvus]|uniref:ligand-binding sensor domain-containing protein n=1 Tax=Myxococcus fulvus TaxID=33 RepID=UPI003B9CED7B